ncbi:MAG: ABC transporter ATP-binding protein/permease [Alphaproteobacteria bacterium]|nr:ABC transporter ATP-binding protein/permease [Alphaproteobacteria bacterium]
MSETGLTTTKAQSWNAARPLLRLAQDFVRPYRATIAVIMGLMVVEAGLTAALAYLLDPAIKHLFPVKDPSMLILIPSALLGVMILKAGTSYFSGVALARIGQGVVNDLQVAMFAKVTRYDIAKLNAMHSGQFAARFLNDAGLIRESVTRSVQGMVRDVLTIVGLGAVMFYQDWPLALILCTVLPVTALFTLNLGRQTSKAATQSMASTGDLATHLSETLDGRRVIKAYRMEDHAIGRATHIVTERMRHLMKGAQARASATPAAEALAGVGIAAVMFYAANRGMEISSFMSFLGAMMLSYQSIRTLSNFYTALSEGSAAAARAYTLLDAPSDITDAPGAKALTLLAGAKRAAISFKQVQFAYGGVDVAALSDVTFNVPAGKTVALVGPSGAGKSTLLNLILRFYDVTGGSIEIDGQDIRGVSVASLRDASALVTQDPFLFDETVADNIGCGKAGATQAEIEDAARVAAAHEFILALPQGYQTLVGEAGVRLSGGQRQRIAIARAILKNAPILLLDEATSSLDSESERAVQAALTLLMQDRTTLVIAHRLSTIVDADKIVVFDQGQVIEQGTHGELLARNGLYARLYRTQYAETRTAPAAVAE